MRRSPQNFILGAASLIVLLGLTLSPPLPIAARPRSTGRRSSSERRRTPRPEDASSAGATGDWSARVRSDLERQEYVGSATRDGWQAPNRAQNLRARFRCAGVELEPRVKGASNWCWHWETIAWGRDGSIRSVAAVSPASHGLRIEYPREGLTEWYENRKEGLEQGFTFASRPDGEGMLRIQGRVAAGLHPRPSEDGESIDFLDERGARVLRYGELVASDARGARLAARLSVADGALAIEVDDRGAAYPIVIDPLMTTPAWTAESDQDYGSLGFSVSTAGDVNADGYSDVIVSAYVYDNGQLDEGRAYVYLGSASGLALTPAWTAEGNQADARFGYSVATAGDVNGDGYADVIVGAIRYDNGAGARGRAYVYLGSASGLALTPAWTADGDQTGAEFAGAVATAGDVNGDGYADVIVGAQYYDDPLSDEGRAYVYLGSASGLALTAAWVTAGSQNGAGYGNAVATAGDVNGDGYADVIVGAYHDSNGQFEEGRAFIYLGSASGLALTSIWNGEGNQAFGYFGNSVATAGDVNGDGYADVIVGFPGYTNGQSGEGRALVYLGSVSGPATSAAWTVESNQAGADFGRSVATAGDLNGDGYADVIVGAPNFPNGRAFAYLGSASGLATTAVWSVDGGQAGAILGNSVATAGDVNGDGYSDVIVGAPNSSNGQTAEGRAYVYLGSASGPAATAGWTAESDQATTDFGVRVGTAGDVNGDGYSDVIVGADLYDNGETDEGRAFVYLGSASGLAATPAWTAEGDQANASFGGLVGTAGDVNGDGYSDVIVGAYLYDNGETDEGRAFVYLGSASGLAPTAAWTAEGNQAGAWFGGSVATAGDVNGDGYSDVIVGAPAYDNGQTDEGRAFVYLGSATGLAATAAWTAESDQAVATFGYSVATAGDVNGDGFSDVIVGAPTYDNGLTDEGRAFVYLGSASGLAATAAWIAEGYPQVDARFGISVATAGDVNSDGYSDVIVGANHYSSGEDKEGGAFVYHGSDAGLAIYPNWNAESDQVGARLGISVACAGDVNGDGYSDVIIGADFYSNGEASEGRSYVYPGSLFGLTSTAWTAESNQAVALFGEAVATAGDVNGDGYSDVIVGAPLYDNGQTDEGGAFLYYGNGGDGIDRSPRQLQAAGSPPISLLGKSASNSFRLQTLGRSPAGRGNVRMEWEARPLGTAFAPTGHTLSSVSNTGAPVGGIGSATPVSSLASGLLFATPYHWRLRTLTDSPFFPRSPWFSLPYNGSTETDLRTAAIAVGVSEPIIEGGLRVEMIRPNPSHSEAVILYTLARPGRARLWIHDLEGRTVRLLVDGDQAAGPHSVVWDGLGQNGTRTGPGIYWVRLRSGGEVSARKLIHE